MTKAALIVVVMMAPAVAVGQPINGFYAQGSAGLAFPESSSIGPVTPTPGPSSSSASTVANTALSDGTGGAQSGSAGWGLGNGLRLEIEGLHGTQPIAIGH